MCGLARGVPIRRNFWRLPAARKATGHCRGGLRPGDDGGGYLQDPALLQRIRAAFAEMKARYEG